MTLEMVSFHYRVLILKGVPWYAFCGSVVQLSVVHRKDRRFWHMMHVNISVVTKVVVNDDSQLVMPVYSVQSYLISNRVGGERVCCILARL